MKQGIYVVYGEDDLEKVCILTKYQIQLKVGRNAQFWCKDDL